MTLRIEALVRGLQPPDVYWCFGPVSTVPPTERQHRHHRGSPRPTSRKGTPKMSYTLKDDERVPVKVKGIDSRQNPTALTGTPAFTVDNPTILTLTDHGDGTCVVAATGTLGTAVLSVADTETDGGQFAGSVSVDVLAGSVTAVALDMGTAEKNV